jgi:hypothetical protein
MDNMANTAQVVIRPPLAWGLAVIAGLALNWLVPLPFLPADLPAGWIGATVFVLAPVRLGHRYYHQGRFERPHQPADHHHRRERTVPLRVAPVPGLAESIADRQRGASRANLRPPARPASQADRSL